MECELCYDNLPSYPFIIELYKNGKFHNFCCDDCASEWLYNESDAMEIENPEYAEEDD